MRNDRIFTETVVSGARGSQDLDNIISFRAMIELRARESRDSLSSTMLRLLCVVLLPALCSCALGHHRPDESSMLDGDPGGADREEYGELEYLEEHPLDPMTAEPRELRSLPGIPDRLVERLIAERGRNTTIRRLFESLTPPEREALRRYEPYLELPGRRPLRLEAWYTADRHGPEGERRDDLRLTCRSDRFRLSARYRSEEIYRLYIAGSPPTGHVRLHGGDFVPDLAMGLCFSSHMTSYPFSHGYHIRKRRWVGGATSLYGASMRGGAAEFWVGPARLLLLGGRQCSYSDGRLDVDGPAILCGRFALVRNGFSVGATLHTVDGQRHDPICSIDASSSRERFDVAAEIASDGEGWSGVWALSVHGKREGMSILIYDIPPEWDHSMGRSFYGAGKRRRGGSIVLDQRLARSIRLFAAFERSAANDPYEVKRSDLIRFECRWSEGGNSMKLSLKRRIGRRSILMPCPSSDEQPEDEMTDSIHLLQAWRLPASLRLRISCRAPFERGRSGYLVCPSLTFDRRFSATISWAVHRAIEGSPLFYCYERSPRGLYPWRALRDDGWRVALIGALSVGPTRLALSLAAQNGGLHEGAAQIGVTF